MWLRLVRYPAYRIVYLSGPLSPDTIRRQRPPDAYLLRVLAELDAQRAGQTIYYVEPDVVDFVWKSRYDVDYEYIYGAVRALGGVFSVALPGDKLVNGQPLYPTLVRAATRDELQNQINSYPGVYCAIQFDRAVNMYLQHHGGYFSFSCSHQYDMEQLLNNTRFDYQSDQSQIRLLLGILVYMSVFPALICDGFPEQMRTRERRHAGSDAQPRTLSLHPEFLGSVKSPHFRSGCFRSLRSDRYKRAPDGTVRVIYVRDTWVAKDRIKSKTVKRAREEK